MKNFDFDTVGKKMPYIVSEEFFANITQETLREAKLRELKRKAVVKRYWFASASITVAAAVLLFGLFTNLGINSTNQVNIDTLNHSISLKNNQFEYKEIDNLLQNLSDEEITLLAEYSYNDVFYDQH